MSTSRLKLNKQSVQNHGRRERTIPIQIEGEDDCNVTSTTQDDVQITSGNALDDSQLIEGSQSIQNQDEQETAEESDEKLQNNKLSSDEESDDTSSEVPFTPINIPERTLPAFNIPENIIIALDPTYDDHCSHFEVTCGKKYSPLYMVKHALEVFLHNKHFINKNHQYALVVLNENSATWVHNFTNSVRDIISTIEAVKECEPEDIFNLNSLFDIVNCNIVLPATKTDILIPPTTTYRTILLYGRSYSIPEIEYSGSISELLQSPYFTVDVVMTHEPPSSANHCTKIFKTLQEINTDRFGYSFAVARNARNLHVAMAKLLSHPLQRPHQLSAKYEILQKLN